LNADHFIIDDKNTLPPRNAKLTLQNLEYIYSDIKTKQLTSYNLIVISSTFHILKTAIEVEKYFYNQTDNKPDNIIFIGNEKFFELAHNSVNCNDKKQSLFHKKKLKSFLYELFMHALDKNAIMDMKH
jgi:hypothetical protein